MTWLKTNLLWIFILAYVLFAALVITLFNGTGDSGDSILHYLFAKSAPKHPELYFNHWAKPVFTLLASPFAQFGFIGMKIFNALVVLMTIVLTHRTAVNWQLKRPIFAALLIACAPLLIRHTFSGLTEPLFALFIAAGMFYTSRNKWAVACALVSFLPFVRSEGLIVITAFGLLLLVRRQWKAIPWLLFGHLVYSVAGWFHYKDILWVFTKIPYATTTSNYGNGDLFHFVDQLPFVIGIPSVLILAIGTLVLIVRWIRGQFNPNLHALILYGFLSYFIAHSMFWYLGIFNSMGLNRVLLGIIPFIAILGLVGVNTLLDGIKNQKIQLGITSLIAVLLLTFPIWENPSSVHWQRDMNLSQEQQAAQEAADFAITQKEKGNRFIYLPPYLSMALRLDHFDFDMRGDLHPIALKNIQPGDVLIWDNWFSPVDGHVTQQAIEESGSFKKLKEVKYRQEEREIVYIVYKAK